MLNVRYAPVTDPAVATAAYSYPGSRWRAARIAVKMSGPPNVGRGELSRIARKRSPSAPKWRNIEVQTGFVDEPRRTVEEADKLVAAVMQRLAEGFANERSGLEKQWDSGDNV